MFALTYLSARGAPAQFVILKAAVRERRLLAECSLRASVDFRLATDARNWNRLSHAAAEAARCAE